MKLACKRVVGGGEEGVKVSNAVSIILIHGEGSVAQTFGFEFKGL